MYNNISLVVAIAHDNAIGANNQLLVHVPGDLPRFKALTTGHTVVMGRKTFDSLPKGALPNRRNIVMTHQVGLQLVNCEVAHSVEGLFESVSSDEEIFVIGGSEIYSLFLPFAKKLFLTILDKSFPSADAFFPHINFEEFTLQSEELIPVSEKNDFKFSYQTWHRK